MHEQLDVTDGASVSSFAQRLKQKYGGCTILINNAGVSECCKDACWFLRRSPASLAGCSEAQREHSLHPREAQALSQIC